MDYASLTREVLFLTPHRLSHATVASDLRATGTSPSSASRAGENDPGFCWALVLGQDVMEMVDGLR